MIYGYCRVSTVDQAADDKTSLATQERIIRGKALGHGWGEPVIFSDVGVSGSIRLQDRPEGGKLLAVLRKGDVVISAKMDRIFRSLGDAATTADRFIERGIGLILADMGDSPVTEPGPAQMFFGMMATFAQFERWRLAERMRDGKRGKKALGGHVGGLVPYGFSKIGSGREARLVENPDEVVVLERVRELRAGKMSLDRISLALESDGLLNRVGKPFNRKQIDRLLKRAA